MKNIKKLAVFCISAFLTFSFINYLIFSFVEWNFNPFYWGAYDRFFCAILIFVLTWIAIGMYTALAD